jgi:tetratricopeptide (TPR) repeat protein
MQRALDLNRDLPATRLAQIYYVYRCDQDFQAAYQLVTSAAERFPQNAEILQALGFVLRRKGQLPQAIKALDEAFAQNPRTFKLIWAVAETYRAMRKYRQADWYYTQAIALAPDEAKFWEELALNRLDWTESIEDARETLRGATRTGDTGLIPIEFYLDFFDRNYGSALSRLTRADWRELSHPYPSKLAVLQVVALEKLGRHREALTLAETNRSILESRVASYPKDAFYRAYLALTLAQLGRSPEAIGQAEEAVRLKQHDPFTGPRIVEIQAMVEAAVGMPRQAIGHLKQLQAMTYQDPVSAVSLRVNPMWDALRGYDEYQTLLLRSGS